MKLQDITAKKVVVVPGKALRVLIEEKASGLMTIFEPADDSIFWRLHFSQGNLIYATSGMGKTERLHYLLKQLFPNTQFSIPSNLDDQDEYNYIHNILKAGKLSPKQVQKVFYILTQEAIAQVLSLPRAAITYDASHLPLENAVLSLSLKSMLNSLREKISNAARLREAIGSPFQRLQLLEMSQDISKPDLDIENCISFEGLNANLAKKCTLYELSLQTNQTPLTFGNLIKPMVQAGNIKVLSYSVKTDQPKPLIACIDDSKVTQKIVRMTLEASGFQVIGITDPAQALSTFVQQRPDVILMDINMPDINGYELCRMFNQSNMLKSIPVIMLTGRDGFLDRMRARMVGSSDYIAKPFRPEELVQLVKSLVVKPNSSVATSAPTPLAPPATSVATSITPPTTTSLASFSTSAPQLRLA
ncbi:MAG: response regulator [Limnothrix sp. RL_2_0]|nr:response regulator [Limnothrix sp. RL_2_0]